MSPSAMGRRPDERAHVLGLASEIETQKPLTYTIVGFLLSIKRPQLVALCPSPSLALRCYLLGSPSLYTPTHRVHLLKKWLAQEVASTVVAVSYATRFREGELDRSL